MESIEIDHEPISFTVSHSGASKRSFKTARKLLNRTNTKNEDKLNLNEPLHSNESLVVSKKSISRKTKSSRDNTLPGASKLSEAQEKNGILGKSRSSRPN